MACNTARVPFIGTFAKRSLSAKAQAQASAKTATIASKTLPNKLVLATLDNDAPIARVAVVVKAGSRYETSDNMGASHTIRNSAGLSTKNKNHIEIARGIQQIGASLNCISDRETITYTLEANRDKLNEGVDILKDVVAGQVFKPWELQDNIKRLKIDLKTRPWMTRAIDLLHKAAFRTGLGNSMYCPKSMAGKHDTETLRTFVSQTFTTNRSAVAAVGVPINDLESIASQINLATGDGIESSGVYIGGSDQRLEKHNLGLAYFAVAGQGAGVCSRQDALALGVLRHILCGNPHVKWGSPSGTLGEAVKSAGVSAPFAVNALNVCYTDTGLFGFSAISLPVNAGQVLAACVNALRNANVTDETVTRGKNGLISEVLLSTESNQGILQELGQQAALLGAVSTPDDVVKEICQINTSQVKQAASKVASSKLSLGAIGQLGCLNYLDQL